MSMRPWPAGSSKNIICQGKKVQENLVDMSDPFFSSQQKIVLENCGRINAESIDEYIAVGGYEALAKAVTEMQPPRGHRGDPQERAARARRRRISHRTEVGHRPARRRANRSTSSATPTKETRARSWTGACSKAIRTASWKAWPSPAMPSAQTRGSSISARSTRWPSNGCGWRSSRRNGWDSSETGSSNRNSISASTSGSARAPSSAAKRPP